MADFYQELPPTPADWTNSSKGYKANSIAGDTFQGLGDAVKMGVQAVDNYYEGTIKEQAKSATDELFNASGNAGAVATEAGIKGNFAPKEIQQGYDQLALLKQATQNGSMKDSSFWAQAELISRQLKTRYPGYWEHIDSTMSNLVGRKPAVALHSELEQENKAKASQNEISRKAALTAAMNIGIPEVFVAEQQGKPIPTTEVERMVAQKHAITWQQEASQRQYNLKKSNNELTESDAMLAQRTEATTKLTTLLKDSTSPLFRNAEEYRTYAQQAEQYRAAGKPIPPELQSAVTSTAATINQAVADISNEITLKYAADAPWDKLDNNTKFLQAWSKNFIANVQQADMNYTAQNVAILKSMQDHDTYTFLSSNDMLRKSAALTQAIGPASELAWESNNPQLRADRDIAIQKTMENKHLLEGLPLKEGVSVMMSMGVKDPQAFNAHVTRQMNAVTSDVTPGPIKSSAIEALYGEKNLDFLDTTVPQSQRLNMFLKMSSPQMTQKVKQAHDKGLITTSDYDKHINWVTTNAIQLIRDKSANVIAGVTDRKSLKLNYNQNTQMIEVFRTKFQPQGAGPIGRTIESMGENYLAMSTEIDVGNVNSIIRTLKNMIQTNGEDPKTIIPQLLSKAGLGLEEPEDKDKTDTGLTPIVKAVDEAMDVAARNAKASPRPYALR